MYNIEKNKYYSKKFQLFLIIFKKIDYIMIYSKDNVTFNNVLTSVVSVGTGGPINC